MLIQYLIVGLIGFAMCMLLVLVYSLCYASGRASQGKASPTPLVHPLAWHVFHTCESGRELVFGPTVPEGEVWVLTSMHAKNNSGPTQGINVAIYDGHEWLCLASKAGAEQYDGVAWSGELVMAEGWQLGCWFRGAEVGDVLQCDSTMTLRYDLI